MNQKSEDLYDYWESLRDGRQLPYRREVNPAAFPRMLDSVFILELSSDREISYRLAGTTLCDFVGVELRGMSFLSFWEPQSRDQMLNLLQRVCSQPCVGKITSVLEGDTRSKARLETVFLPLKDDQGEATRILGHTNMRAHPAAFLPNQPARFQTLESATAQAIQQGDPCVPHVQLPKAVKSNQIPSAVKRLRNGGDKEPTVSVDGKSRIFRVIDGGLR